MKNWLLNIKTGMKNNCPFLSIHFISICISARYHLSSILLYSSTISPARSRKVIAVMTWSWAWTINRLIWACSPLASLVNISVWALWAWARKRSASVSFSSASLKSFSFAALMAKKAAPLALPPAIRLL